MTSRSDQPAFPTTAHNYGDGMYAGSGMSLRDYFAAKAMAAAMGNPELNGKSLDDIAAGAYKSADAMLKARKQ